MTVSIITPSYNQGSFIEKTILSVLDQGIADLDYVVFDGGSQDNTLDILRKYESRLRWVSEHDHGQAHAVNKGLAATSGEIIGWLNSDDIYLKDAIRHAQQVFSQHPEVDVVYGNAYHIDSQDNIIETYPTEEWNVQRLTEVCFLSQPAVFFRRRVVERFGSLDESLRYCMDYEYWLRLGTGGAIFFHLGEYLAGSRLYKETKTLGQRVPVHFEINTMMRKTLGRVPDRWLINYAHAQMESVSPGLTSADPAFLWQVAWRSISAAWRWNRRISRSMTATTFSWIKASIYRLPSGSRK